MAINKLLESKKIRPLKECAPIGYCLHCGSETDFTLPNGDYIDKGYYNTLKEDNWIDSEDNYTFKFFEFYQALHPYKDENGIVYALSLNNLKSALKENNIEAYDFLLKILPPEAHTPSTQRNHFDEEEE